MILGELQRKTYGSIQVDQLIYFQILFYVSDWGADGQIRSTSIYGVLLVGNILSNIPSGLEGALVEGIIQAHTFYEDPYLILYVLYVMFFRN